jgi:hypothetical protein
MIHDAQEALLDRGFDNPRQLEDSFGTIGYLLDRGDQLYVLVAKQYAYQNMASFMRPIVEKVNDDVLMLFYSDDDNSYTIFDAGYVKEHGNPSQGASKKRECQWVEISREHGVLLDGFLERNESPRTIAGDNQQLSAFQ